MSRRKIQKLFYLVNDFLDHMDLSCSCESSFSMIGEKLQAIMYGRFWDEAAKYGFTKPCWPERNVNTMSPQLKGNYFYDEMNNSYPVNWSGDFFMDSGDDNYFAFTQSSTYLMHHIKQFFFDGYDNDLEASIDSSSPKINVDRIIQEFPEYIRDLEFLKHDFVREYIQTICLYEPGVEMSILKIEDYGWMKELYSQNPDDPLLQKLFKQISYFEEYISYVPNILDYYVIKTDTTFFFFSMYGFESDGYYACPYWNTNCGEYLIKLSIDIAIDLILKKYKKQCRKEL